MSPAVLPCCQNSPNPPCIRTYTLLDLLSSVFSAFGCVTFPTTSSMTHNLTSIIPPICFQEDALLDLGRESDLGLDPGRESDLDLDSGRESDLDLDPGRESGLDHDPGHESGLDLDLGHVDQVMIYVCISY